MPIFSVFSFSGGSLQNLLHSSTGFFCAKNKCSIYTDSCKTLLLTGTFLPPKNSLFEILTLFLFQKLSFFFFVLFFSLHQRPFLLLVGIGTLLHAQFNETEPSMVIWFLSADRRWTNPTTSQMKYWEDLFLLSPLSSAEIVCFWRLFDTKMTQWINENAKNKSDWTQLNYISSFSHLPTVQTIFHRDHFCITPSSQQTKEQLLICFFLLRRCKQKKFTISFESCLFCSKENIQLSSKDNFGNNSFIIN